MVSSLLGWSKSRTEYFTNTQSDALNFQQREAFENLDHSVQFFISQYAAGHTNIAYLIKDELTSVKGHATKETLRSEESMKEHVSTEVSTAEKSITSSITRETHKAVITIAQRTIESDLQTSTKEQRDQLLQSLRYPAMNERLNNLADSHEATFRWIFESSSELKSWDDFNDWLQSDSDIYWISGKPGSRKSTPMKYLLENSLTKEALATWSDNVVIISHFFWKPGYRMQNNIKGFLCSIFY